MSESSIRLQTYIVCGVMIGCFSILYPKIFHPMLMRSLGIVKPNPEEHEQRIPHRFGPHGPDRPRPSIRGDSESTTAGKRGGILSLVLPVYGVGIVIYLFYTLSKLYKSRQRKNSQQKDEYLKHYYRDFRFDVDRGEFRMGHDTSDEDSPLGTEMSSVSRRSAQKRRKMNPDFTNSSGQFDWAAAYGTDAHPDIYRSTKSLPRDLEDLLFRMENQEVVDNEELSVLRVRLEQTEREMVRLLHAMNAAERLVTDSSTTHRDGLSSPISDAPPDWCQSEDWNFEEKSTDLVRKEELDGPANVVDSEYESDPEVTLPSDPDLHENDVKE